jgi:hypothetical protein
LFYTFNAFIETADKHPAEPTTNGTDHVTEHHPPAPTYAPPPVPTQPSSVPSSSPTKGPNDQHHGYTNSTHIPSIKSKSESNVPPRSGIQMLLLDCFVIFYCLYMMMIRVKKGIEGNLR